MLIAILAIIEICGLADAAPPPDGWVESELGRVRLGTVLGVCKSDSVFIGRVDVAKSRKDVWFPTSTMKRTRVVTDFKFQVERSIKGSHGAFESLTIPGGSVPGMTMRTSMDDRLPKPVPGRRYLIAQQIAGDESLILKAVARIDDDASLPSVQDILKEAEKWKGDYCE